MVVPIPFTRVVSTGLTLPFTAANVKGRVLGSELMSAVAPLLSFVKSTLITIGSPATALPCAVMSNTK